jgi:ribosome biogenesis GTPase
VAREDGDVLAELPGRLRHEARDRSDLPAVGDWVAVDPSPGRTLVRAVLPRRTVLVRKVAGGTSESQVIAANVDVVLVAAAAGADVNERRLERYLTFAWSSGAQPVVLLTKADLEDDVAERVASIEAASPGVPVVAVSALTGAGIDRVAELLPPAKTGVVVGSSGVGKSTLINRLLGTDLLLTQRVRAHDERGMHTTTSRRLVPLPNGALLVDTPGMRELALADDDGLDGAFADVEALAAGCRFGDCAHGVEPHCAVLRAVEDGSLDPERLHAFRALQREIAYLARKQDVRLRLQEQRRWKNISRASRRLRRERGE